MITDLHKRADGPVGPPGLRAFFALGFRPFFFLGALFATVAVPVWLAVWAGEIDLPTALPGAAWHAHEMVFGFAAAIVAGFLLTAVRNWTGRPMPDGAQFGGLVLVWALGRGALLVDGPLPPVWAAAIDLAFLPLVALSIGRPIVQVRAWRNLGFVPLLLFLTGANALFHFGGPEWAAPASRLGVDIILLVVTVIGGRVIPSFTENAVRVETRRSRWLDWAAFVGVTATTILELVPAATAAGVVAVATGLAHGGRMLGWRSWASRRHPILWVLHAGYAWLALGFVLRGAGAFVPGWMPTAPTHALTVGAIGVLVLGMSSRVSLGHTGRPIVAPRPIVAAYVMLLGAAAVRALGPLGWPGAYAAELAVSATLWAAAFGTFAAVYLPVLWSPRVDGKPG